MALFVVALKSLAHNLNQTLRNQHQHHHHVMIMKVMIFRHHHHHYPMMPPKRGGSLRMLNLVSMNPLTYGPWTNLSQNSKTTPVTE